MAAPEFDLRIGSAAKRDFKKLDKKEQRVLKKAIEALRENPFPDDAEKMKGYKDVWRIRKGQYRIGYRVDKKSVVVLVLRIGDRKEIYGLIAQLLKRGR